jgi:hypothetical protein
MTLFPQAPTIATRNLRPELAAVLQRLQPGQRLRITQTVRVGLRSWTATVTGTFREIRLLATGLATDRVPEDDIVVPTVHFTKDNGELSSVALDEHTKIEIIS